MQLKLLWICGWIWCVFLHPLRIRTQFHSPVEAHPVQRWCEIYANSAQIVPETRWEQTHQATATLCRPEPRLSCCVSELAVSNLTLIFLLMPWALCHRHQRCACVPLSLPMKNLLLKLFFPFIQMFFPPVCLFFCLGQFWFDQSQSCIPEKGVINKYKLKRPLSLVIQFMATLYGGTLIAIFLIKINL